jgi:hypothetical protein
VKNQLLTKGWDTISIVRQEQINSDLAGIWPTIDSSFSYKSTDLSIKGVFASWKIVNGGGGRILRLELPIKSGEFALKDQKMNLAGTSAIIEVTLSLLPAVSSVSVLKSQYKRLAKSRADMVANQDGWVLPIKFIDPDNILGPYATVALDAIVSFLLENPQNFELIFAEINFAKSGSPDWALPKKCTYAYLDSGYLAVLAVCSNKDISNLPLDIDVSGMPLGRSSFYIMSAELMLLNLIMPGLISIYQNCSSAAFFMRGQEMLNNKELRMHEIKSGAIYYTPVVYKEKNVSRIEGSRIKIYYDGKCDLYAGINMYWNGSVRMNCVLEDKGAISFYQDGSSFNHHEDIPWYLKWLSPIVSIIVAIVVSIISDDLIASIKSKSSYIKASTIDSVTWCKKQATVKAVSISESLIMEY